MSLPNIARRTVIEGTLLHVQRLRRTALRHRSIPQACGTLSFDEVVRSILTATETQELCFMNSRLSWNILNQVWKHTSISVERGFIPKFRMSVTRSDSCFDAGFAMPSCRINARHCTTSHDTPRTAGFSPETGFGGRLYRTVHRESFWW